MTWRITSQEPGELKRRVVAGSYPTRSSAHRARRELIKSANLCGFWSGKKYFLEEVSPGE